MYKFKNPLMLFLLNLIYLINGIKLQLSTGEIEGNSIKYDHHQTMHVFKKIPFAQPPLGQLRFFKPLKPLKWNGTLETKEYGPSCMTSVTFYNVFSVNHDEDCLYLNVFTSQRCLENKNCSVLILQHGGAFIFGSSDQYSDAKMLAKFVQHDIIYITTTHRLGPFGFLDLGEDKEDEAPYNVGLYDIIAALEWIQCEINVFGGDPKQVTLHGYSSGATAIQFLLSSPKLQSHKLFQKAVLDSGMPVMAPGMVREFSLNFVNESGCLYLPFTHKLLTIKEQIKCLRSKSAEYLTEKSAELERLWGHVGPQPNEDLLPGRFYADLAEKRKPIPLLVITSKEEMGHLYDVNASMAHICRDELNVLGYTHEATIATCMKRYHSIYNKTSGKPIVKDAYHAVATKECMWNREIAPCYLALFAQVNHSSHAEEMAYITGQKIKGNKHTLNDELMERFMPQVFRNFIRGEQPTHDWLPTTKEGKNYYYLSIQVTSPNLSTHEWPHFVAGQFIDPPILDFFLNELDLIEKNASQFDEKLAFNGNVKQRFLRSFVDGGGESDVGNDVHSIYENQERSLIQSNVLLGFILFLLIVFWSMYIASDCLKKRRRAYDVI